MRLRLRLLPSTASLPFPLLYISAHTSFFLVVHKKQNLFFFIVRSCSPPPRPVWTTAKQKKKIDKQSNQQRPQKYRPARGVATVHVARARVRVRVLLSVCLCVPVFTPRSPLFPTPSPLPSPPSASPAPPWRIRFSLAYPPAPRPVPFRSHLPPADGSTTRDFFFCLHAKAMRWETHGYAQVGVQTRRLKVRLCSSGCFFFSKKFFFCFVLGLATTQRGPTKMRR